MDPTTESHRAPSLSDRSVADALRSYAIAFDCPVGYLEPPASRRQWRRRSGDDAIHTFTRGNVELVSLPPVQQPGLALDIDDLDDLLSLTRSPIDPAQHLDIRGARIELVDDPAQVALVDLDTLQRRPSAPVMLVYNPSPSVLDMLRGAVSPTEWRDGGGDSHDVQRVGALSGGVLVALATAQQPMGRLARLSVIVAPSHRRRGLGLTVLQSLAHRVLNDGLLPYCRLAMHNLAAHALASAVGFVAFARTLSMRIIGASSEISGGQREPR